MSIAVSMPELKVDWCLKVLGGDYVQGWTIKVLWQSEWCVLMNAESPQKSLKFGSQRDAEAALKALNEAGIHNGLDINEAGRPRVVQIACEALSW